MRSRSRLRALVAVLSGAGLFVVGQSWLWRLHRHAALDAQSLIAWIDCGEIGMEMGLPRDSSEAAEMLDFDRRDVAPTAEWGPMELEIAASEKLLGKEAVMHLRTPSIPLVPRGGYARHQYSAYPVWEWDVRVFRFVLPAWVNAAIFALLLAITLLVPGRKIRLNRCRCGYDLMGNQSGQCPECGRVVVRIALDPKNV